MNRINLYMWQMRGSQVPPPHIFKQKVIRGFAKRFGIRIFVETGTFHGDMVAAMKHYFDNIYSIELSPELFEKAKQRFDGDHIVEIIHGDSGVELDKLLDRIDQPALFWLDGHYSAGVTARSHKDTPIFEELTHIYNHRISDHVVIIDDARLFGSDPAYPTIKELCDFVRTKKSDAVINIVYDSIRISPPSVLSRK